MTERNLADDVAEAFKQAVVRDESVKALEARHKDLRIRYNELNGSLERAHAACIEAQTKHLSLLKKTRSLVHLFESAERGFLSVWEEMPETAQIYMQCWIADSKNIIRDMDLK